MANLNSVDKAILKLLQEDAKLTNKEIAAKLNLTTTPVFERIKKLEREGFIKNYVALVDRKKVELSLMAFCNVSLKEHTSEFLNIFEKDVQLLEEVVECYHIAGMFDYLLKVVVKDMDTYQDFVANKLAGLNNIRKVQSAFVMSEIKHSTRFHLGA
ncbi:MAG: Lrp/AsnC family transcriptional regulator [Bacteroidetes bacterium]|jgi:DNA-binding Lrp family transcriptional regulator|nr:Lrp/AsnC family transcriptional regulator [Bacteroidota bacterium]MDF1867610.1 Lrp/AsnC family transcriptional regulator [Saprospiraceae bacterium]